MVEIMSSAKLHAFPTVALILFLMVFAGVIWRALRRGARTDQQHLKQLVLEEEATTTPSPLTTTFTPTLTTTLTTTLTPTRGGAQ